MFVGLRAGVGWALSMSVAGCVIGTWPTPEDRAPSDPKPTQPLAVEACDGLDNDADGAVDEGCACNHQVRGCLGVADGMCGAGLQWCQGGLWQECSEIGPPFAALRPPSVAVLSVSPETLDRGGSETVTVTAAAVTVCAGVVVDKMDVVVAAASPIMRIRAVGRDDGVAPDQAWGDGIYTAALVNPFGPGVGSQALTVSVGAVIDGEAVTSSMTLPLEEP